MPELGKLKSVINCLLILTLLTSCSGKTSAEDMDKEIQNISSWLATVNMVSDAWMRGAVPSKYTQTTLKKAQEELLKEKDNIFKIKASKDVTEQDKSLLLANVLKLANKTEEMSKAVAQKNHLAVRGKLEELAAEQQELNKLKKVAGQNNE